MPDNLAETSPDTVVCVFYDATKSLVVNVPITVNTTLGSRMVATRHAAQVHAANKGFPLFAIPANFNVIQTERWLVFRMETGLAQYLRDWPSYAAAAMWMQHHG